MAHIPYNTGSDTRVAVLQTASVGHFPPSPCSLGEHQDQSFHRLQARGSEAFSIIKTSLAALVIWLGLCSAGALAKPSASDPVQPQKFEEYKAKAEAGNAEAQIALGDRYFDGTGVAKDAAAALQWYRKAADQGNAVGQRRLGFCYAVGSGVEQDNAAAAKWWRMAADQGDATAQANLGECYFYGQGVAQDPKVAVEWFRKAVAQGDATAQNRLGVCYYAGEGVGKDTAEAVKWFRKAAEQDLAEGQYSLGRCYYHGEGVVKDFTAAVKWFRKAAELGHAEGQFLLGVCYNNGEGIGKDSAAAVRSFREAAEQGHAGAQFNLGISYQYGEDVERDFEEAVKWYLKAAEQGLAQAQYNLGDCYHRGEGVAQDATAAAQWYRKAAEQGFADAQYNLGVCYYRGEGVAKDLAEAVKCFVQSAQQGNARAQLALGHCYAMGRGVEKNHAEAVSWYRKAAKQGFEPAQRYLAACLADAHEGGTGGLTGVQKQQLIDHLGPKFQHIQWAIVIFSHLGLIYDNRTEPRQLEIERLKLQAHADPQNAACRYRLGCLLMIDNHQDEGDVWIKEAEEIYRKRLEADPGDLQGLTGLASILRGTAEGGRMARHATEVAPKAWESWQALAMHQVESLKLKCFEGIAKLPAVGIDQSRLKEALELRAQSEEQCQALFDLGREALASSLKAIDANPTDPEPFLRHLAIQIEVTGIIYPLHRVRGEPAPSRAEVDRQGLELIAKAVTLCRDRPEALGAMGYMHLMTTRSLLQMNADSRPDSKPLRARHAEVIGSVLTRLRELCDSPDSTLAASAAEAYGALLLFESELDGHSPLAADVPALLARAVQVAPRRSLAWDLRIAYAGIKPDGEVIHSTQAECALATERAKILKTARSQALIGLLSPTKESSKAAWEMAVKLEPANLEYLLNFAAASLRVSQTEESLAAVNALLQKASEIWFNDPKWQARPELDAYRLRLFAVQQALGGDLEGARRTVGKVLEDYPGDAETIDLQALVSFNTSGKANLAPHPDPTQP